MKARKYYEGDTIVAFRGGRREVGMLKVADGQLVVNWLFGGALTLELLIADCERWGGEPVVIARARADHSPAEDADDLIDGFKRLVHYEANAQSVLAALPQAERLELRRLIGLLDENLMKSRACSRSKDD